MPIKIGDIELRLPHGMFLHRDFERKRFHSIVKLTETNSYIQRKNQVIEQEELLREEQRKIAKRLLETGPQKAKKTTGLNVPIYI
jgi:Tfp pilus assembly protein PilN